MDQYKVSVLMGDGIGPEIINQSIKVLNKVSSKCGFKVNYIFSDVGGAAIEKHKNPLPRDTIDNCKNSDSILIGAVGGSKWDHLPLKERPESAVLNMRKIFNLFADIRPIVMFDGFKSMNSIKQKALKNFKNILIVRELMGGIYFGKKVRYIDNGKIVAFDTEIYREDEIIRIARIAFDLAQKRSKKLVSVDKSNILESSKLWREVVNSVSENYKDVELTHMYIDNCIMQIIKDPSQFDVILTSNMFGDIISVEASAITGSMGFATCSNIRNDKFGLYGPINDSKFSIAGKNIANPIASILSAAMMLKYSFSEIEAAYKIEQAVDKSIKIGRTIDMHIKGTVLLSCSEMGDLICRNIN